jgi:uncharacterized protein YecT (DUF1311 family)
VKKFILVVSSLMIASFSFSQTQSEMNIDAENSFEKADKELNDVYTMILKEYKEDTAFIKNLKISQRIWIQFRDAEMNMKYPQREDGYYGKVESMCWYKYEEDLTKERTKKLKVWLQGIKEGDVCIGSVKIKE